MSPALPPESAAAQSAEDSPADSFARRVWYHVFLASAVVLYFLDALLLESGALLGADRYSSLAMLLLAVVFARRSRVELAVALALSTTAIVLQLVERSLVDPLHQLSLALQIAFLGFIVLLLLREILSHGVVTSGTLSGALVIYLLISVGFATGYDLIDCSTQGEAIAGLLPAGEATTTEQILRRQQDLAYFSLTTMTTLGYGDIAPRAPLARTLAAFQAFVGQVYLAVLIARLVSLYRPARAAA